MPRINFQQQLVALKDKLLAMAALSQQSLSLSLEAYMTADMGLCEHVFEIEAAINSAETSVDDMAYDLLAKEQPMAIDLRFILSVIKINGDLERIGDQASNIAQRAMSNRDLPQISLPVDIPEMGERVGVMIRTAVQSLLEADAKLPEAVERLLQAAGRVKSKPAWNFAAIRSAFSATNASATSRGPSPNAHS